MQDGILIHYSFLFTYLLSCSHVLSRESIHVDVNFMLKQIRTIAKIFFYLTRISITKRFLPLPSTNIPFANLSKCVEYSFISWRQSFCFSMDVYSCLLQKLPFTQNDPILDQTCLVFSALMMWRRTQLRKPINNNIYNNPSLMSTAVFKYHLTELQILSGLHIQ